MIKTNKQLKIGWILLGNKTVGSSRIHGLNIHEYLIKNGFNSNILQSPRTWSTDLELTLIDCLKIIFSGYNVIIFQKVYGKNSVIFARICKLFRIKTIYIQADLIDNPMLVIVDKVIVVSGFLKKYYLDNYDIDAEFIDDAIEITIASIKHHLPKDILKLIWIGHSDNWQTIDIVREALEEINNNNIKLYTISDHPDADYKWDITTICDIILNHDIAVIPSTNSDWSKAKSSNRLTLFSTLGLPIIAHPVPSYLNILKEKDEIYFAEKKVAWRKAILDLKDPLVRNNLAINARKKVINNYTIDVIGQQWIKTLYQLAAKV